ncbi:MAG: tyrosine-type recombinase/integrase [Verrucomicrobia bacterium]|jgi:integrase|nr:tyrosine-type recombinase/integrase [Verrucomicrobiota bacterium]
MKRRTGHLFKRGQNFYVAWRVNGKAFSKSLRADNGQPITTRRAAEEARAKWMAQFALADETEALTSIAAQLAGRKAELAQWEDARNPPLPLAAAWSAFRASPNRPDCGAATLDQYESQWTAFVRWMRAHYPDGPALRDVSPAVAAEYAAALHARGLAPSTFNKHLNLLALVFRVLKEPAKLAGNPWPDLPRKRLIAHGRRELTIEELAKVCRAATGELRLLLALGLYTGLRLSDCATLRWGEVDSRRHLIRRIPRKTARHNPRPVMVPLHPVLAGLLAEIPVAARGEYVLPDLAARYARRSDAVTDLVQAHFRACGIQTHKPGTGPDAGTGQRAVVEVGFHSLRHSFVSLCRAQDVPLAVVESIVGHSSPAMTRHYTHVGALAAGQAVATLPAVLGEIPPRTERRDADAVVRAAGRIAAQINARNWRAQKQALLNLLGDGGNP